MSDADQPAPSCERLSRRGLLRAMTAATCVPSALGACETIGARKSALVIGAGIGGLSAAHELKKGGFDVTIFEKWDFVGGRMRDAEIQGVKFAPHALGVSLANREMFDLAKEVGVGDLMMGTVESDAGFVDNGHGKYETGLRFSIDEVARLPGVTDETRRALPKLAPEFANIRRNVDSCLLSTGAAYDNETVTEFFERVLGKVPARQVLDYWMDPVLAAWGWPANETSKIAILSWTARSPHTVTPKGGIGVLTRKLGSMMHVTTNTSVCSISPPDGEGRHTVHYIAADGQRRAVTPDVVVCATEGKYIPELVQDLDPEQKSFFSRIHFTKAVGAIYILAEGAAPPRSMGGGYVQTHPDPLKRRVGHWSWDGPGTLHPTLPTASIYLSRPAALEWQKSNQDQSEYCLPFLRALAPGFDPSKITDAIITGCDDLIYMPVGYIRSMARILERQNASKKGLYFAGEYMAGAHTGAACASGRTVGRTIVRHFA